MNGVEILSQTEIFKEVQGYGSLVGVLIFMISVIFISIYFFKSKGDAFEISCLFVLVSAMISLMVGGIVECCTESEVPTGKYKYKVIISDDVKMNEFVQKYEIVDQDGKIYVVREKNNVR